MTPAGIRWPAMIDGWPESLFQTKLTTRDLDVILHFQRKSAGKRSEGDEMIYARKPNEVVISEVCS